MVRRHETISRTIELYPCLERVRPELKDLVAECGPFTAAAGMQLFSEQEPCIGFPLVLEGEVSVGSRAEDGRSLQLYRVTPGEFCLVSMACLYRSSPLRAYGIAVRRSTLLVVPQLVFRNWLRHEEFRDVVIRAYAERMADLTALVEAIAFRRLEQRLAAALLGYGPVIVVTHQDLANVLGTVREIVSRLLQRFQSRGWIVLSRERIRIVDSAALRAHAGTR